VLTQRYIIEAELGLGDLHRTYLARDLQASESCFYIIKEFNLQGLDRETIGRVKEEFDRHVALLKTLGQHPQIPQFLVEFQENDRFYWVQEYIPGHDLTEEIEPGSPWTQEQVIALLEEILTPLAVIHEQGLIHGAIEPNHLRRRDQDQQVVLIDFVTSFKQSVLFLNDDYGIKNLPEIYQPQEQTQGNPQLSSDIYAVGIVAIEALTGKLASSFPFDPYTKEVNWQDFAPKLSPGFQDILQTMVRADFRQRYPSATEALNSLHQWKSGLLKPLELEETSARSEQSPHLYPMTRRMTRRRWIQVGGGVGLGLVGSLMGRWVWKNWVAQSPEVNNRQLLASPQPQTSPKLSEPQWTQFEFETVAIDYTGAIVNRRMLQARSFQEALGEDLVLDMIVIPGGSFLMGSPGNEEHRDPNESPQHWVDVPRFYMGKFPVTQAQWRTVAAYPKINRSLDPDPSGFKGNNLPVERVSWQECTEFCARLSEYTGRKYRLPSEAEWEYACRAQTTTPFYYGQTLISDVANYIGTSTYGRGPKGIYRQKTTPVGTFPANRFGLYDMHGNVWEWCADHWHDSYENAPTDGSIWLSSNEGVHGLLRGGSWYFKPEECRCANRFWADANYGSFDFGFRLVCEEFKVGELGVNV